MNRVFDISRHPFLAALLVIFSSQAFAVSLPDFTELVEENSAAVVNISTVQKVQGKRVIPHVEIPDLPEDSPFGELFRKFFGEGGESEGLERDARSLGSGFIISNDGYVLSNYHVVKDADEIIVRLNDRRELKAELVGFDKRSDIALLKIEATDLPVARIGSSEQLRRGEWVLAIGSPFGFESSVTAGIVSATGRNLPSENYVPFIQTDVAINPGNSGGPLFNLDGKVVGINSQIYSRTGGYMGLSFAIPIEVAMDVVAQLKDKGHVTRGWLGVLIQDVTRDLAESFGMKKPQGALVAQVLPGGPAENSGLRVGDIILEFNGHHVDSSGKLPPVVGRTPVGKRVPVTVLREGKQQKIWIKLGELPDEAELKSSKQNLRSHSDNRLGVDVIELTNEQRESLELSEYGVLVEAVKPGPAAQAGIHRGDVVVMINNINVKDTRHFETLIKELPAGKRVALLVQRRGGPVFLAIRVPE
ncbi:serine peptidase [Solemya pervernicosa gill symbiont]|uniref:Probable periplasmic serine endoprotease DegP-like n=2 Tax=Gammaproteobacteria incertae sedis TaxID=118884 RepID=A0A1T2LA98_9GAMM|nr:DegQ family serine endoprotease [Candidatus Reidiella endopervernicosa]OOZ42025.1 serine peptidase [Solemya pervernicosa gill symbiont]QKQ27033.1 DegQ family serine endoprotease [Candidatus Reidiella endopervernicosa]